MGNPRPNLKLHVNERTANPLILDGAAANVVRELAKKAARRDYAKALEQRIKETKP